MEKQVQDDGSSHVTLAQSSRSSERREKVHERNISNETYLAVLVDENEGVWNIVVTKVDDRGAYPGGAEL